MSSPPSSPVDGNRSSFRNVVFSRIPDDGKSPKTQQFCVIHHRQNHLESTFMLSSPSWLIPWTFYSTVLYTTFTKSASLHACACDTHMTELISDDKTPRYALYSCLNWFISGPNSTLFLSILKFRSSFKFGDQKDLHAYETAKKLNLVYFSHQMMTDISNNELGGIRQQPTVANLKVPFWRV
jgi:hypothetical protein